MGPSFGVDIDALRLYHHLAAFIDGDMKARDIGRTVDLV